MATTYADIAYGALSDLGVIRPGETPSSTVQADLLLRLNQLLKSLSIEGLVCQTQAFISTITSAGTSRYTVGSGGAFNTGARAEGIIAWKATGGLFSSGGAPLTFPEFDAQVAQAQAGFQIANAEASKLLAPFFQTSSAALTSCSVPMILAADSAYPLLNIAIFPAVSATVELAYWTALTAVAALTDVVSLPDGWEEMLRANFAIALHPRYARQGFDITTLAANAQNTKQKLVDLHTSKQPAPAQK